MAKTITIGNFAWRHEDDIKGTRGASDAIRKEADVNTLTEKEKEQVQKRGCKAKSLIVQWVNIPS